LPATAIIEPNRDCSTNQFSVAKAYNEFNEDGTMKDSRYRDRVVDVIEELHKFPLLLRDKADYYL